MLDPTGGLLREMERRIDVLERRRQLAAGSVSAADIVSEPWRVIGAPGEPAFQNTWAAYGFGFAVPAFALIGGIVHLKGLLGGGPAGITLSHIFTLPAGYRPAGDSIYAVKTNAGVGRIDIRADGDVMWNPLNASETFNAYASLNDIPPYPPA